MLDSRVCSCLRAPSLVAPLLLLWLGSTTPAFAHCDPFTPFGQPVHRSLANDAGVSPAPQWTVICHAGQLVAFNPVHNVSDRVPNSFPATTTEPTSDNPTCGQTPTRRSKSSPAP